MPFTLFLDSFVCGDKKQCRVGSRSACHHVLQKFFVTGRIDYNVRPDVRTKPNLRDVDRNILVSFGLESIHQECPLKRHSATLADRLNILKLAFWK